MKECSNCKENLPYQAFNKFSDSKDGYQGYCRQCMKKKKALYRYGLREEEYDEAMSRDTCDLCDRNYEEFGLKKCIDHDHNERLHVSYRGTICDECNKGLGNFRDDQNLLHNAANYLASAINKRHYQQKISYKSWKE